MRRLLAITLCFLLLTSELFANTKDWKSVEKLKPGQSITVTLRDGRKISGLFESVNDSGLKMAVFTSPDGGFGSFREIERGNIRKIVRINDANLPSPQKVMATGALIGGATGATVGAIQDSRQGNNGRWFVGGLAGAGLGFLASTGVVLGVGVHSLVHHSTVIYEVQGGPH
jgi:hypothetical protein